MISSLDSDEEGFSASRSPSDVLAYKDVGAKKLLLVLFLAPMVLAGVLRFSSLHKNQHFHIPISSRNWRCYTRQFFLQLVPQFCCAVARQVARNVA